MEGARHAATGGIHPDRVGCADSHLRPSFSHCENLMSQSSPTPLQTHTPTHTRAYVSCSQVIAVFDAGVWKMWLNLNNVIYFTSQSHPLSAWFLLADTQQQHSPERELISSGFFFYFFLNNKIRKLADWQSCSHGAWGIMATLDRFHCCTEEEESHAQVAQITI